MLYKDIHHKIFKVSHKNYIVIVFFCLLSVCVNGCSNSKKIEISQITDTEDRNQIKDRSEKNAKPSEKGKKKFSELCDWNSARIKADFPDLNFGYGLILQNQDYVFYPEDGNKLVRISKFDGEKKIIYKAKYDKTNTIHYFLTDTGLFIEYANNIYFCDFEGKNKYKVISRKKIKKQITAIEPDGWHGGIKTIYFYKDNLYFVTFFYVWKLDLSTNKIEKMSKDTVDDMCFCNNKLYYTDNISIYTTNINTGKCKRIIGPKKNEKENVNIPKKYYPELVEADGKVYYIQKQGVENLVLYMYRNGKADKKIYEFNVSSAAVSSIESCSGKIFFGYRKGSGKDRNIIIYDIKSSAITKIDRLKHFDASAFLFEDMLFYFRYGKKYKNLICLIYD